MAEMNSEFSVPSSECAATSGRYDAVMLSWPHWWNYEVVLSPHVLERMEMRGFTEVELRAMLSDATGYRPSIVPGRYVIETRHAGRAWEVVVEPDDADQILVVVTAYEVE